MTAADTEAPGRLAASRERFEELNVKLKTLHSRVGQLREAIHELNSEQAQVVVQLARARRAMHECVGAVELVARLHGVSETAERARQASSPAGGDESQPELEATEGEQADSCQTRG